MAVVARPDPMAPARALLAPIAAKVLPSAPVPKAPAAAVNAPGAAMLASIGMRKAKASG